MRSSSINKKSSASRLTPKISRGLGPFVERKVYTQAYSQNPTTTGQTVSVCSVLQGTDIQNRIGRHIRALYMDIVVNQACLSTTLYDQLSVAVVLDTAASAGLPPFTTVMDTTICGPIALQNVIVSGKRFRVLKWIDATVGGGGPQSQTDRFRIQIPSSHSIFEFAGAATSYPITNAVFLCISSGLSSTLDYTEILVQTVFEDM